MCMITDVERDSRKDEAVVFIFIFATAGLLGWALIRPWVERWVERWVEVCDSDSGLGMGGERVNVDNRTASEGTAELSACFDDSGWAIELRNEVFGGCVNFCIGSWDVWFRHRIIACAFWLGFGEVHSGGGILLSGSFSAYRSVVFRSGTCGKDVTAFTQREWVHHLPKMLRIPVQLLASRCPDAR